MYDCLQKWWIPYYLGNFNNNNNNFNKFGIFKEYSEPKKLWKKILNLQEYCIWWTENFKPNYLSLPLVSFFPPFIGCLLLYKAPLSLVDMLHVTGGGQLVEGSVLSGSLFSLLSTSFGLLLARTLVLVPCLFFSPLCCVGCFLFIKLPSF